MSLSTGQIVNNRYRVARALGHGGMGAVYRAWDLTLNIPVALKEMLPDPSLAVDQLEQFRRQFRQEAQILAGLHHPNLPRVTDFFVWSGNDYLVMDFVDGESLAATIERRGPLPEHQVVAWGLQLLDAIAACHQRSVLHRDIKPQNIIIRSDGRAVLVDFGLVKLWDPSRPQTQRIIRGMGTREYASPEQFGLQRGAHTEPRSDLYSLGATLYHALTGREPPSAMDRLIGGEVLASPRDLGIVLSPKVENVLIASMALQPERRFPSVEAMRLALAADVAARPVGSGSIAQPSRTTPYMSPAPVRDAPATGLPQWVSELGVAIVLAVVATLSLQIITFLDVTPSSRMVGLTIGAVIVGAAGWFAGDVIHEALLKPETGPTSGARPVGESRPTQRLVVSTRKLVSRMTPVQQVVLLAALVGGTVLIAWLLGPVVAKIPWLWDHLPSWAVAAPMVYAATGHRQGLTGLAHMLVSVVGGAVLKARADTMTDMGKLILGAVVGAVLLEVCVFVSRRVLARGRAVV